MEGIEAYDHLFKFVLVGDAGVGKSALLMRFSDDTFTQSYISTIGVDFRIRTIEVYDIRVKLQIWDTAGQERFRTITSSYLRGAHAIIVCYDITDKDSFLAVSNHLAEIQRFRDPSSSVMILAGLKADLRHARKVWAHEGQAYAQRYNMAFIEISSKDNKNIENAMRFLASALLQRSQDKTFDISKIKVQDDYEEKKINPIAQFLKDGTTTKWIRSKIMIVGAGRAGKTALTRSLTGEGFSAQLESTIGINELACDIKQMQLRNEEGVKGEEDMAKWGHYKTSNNKYLVTAIAKEIKRREITKMASPAIVENKDENIITVSADNPDRVELSTIPVAHSSGAPTMDDTIIDPVLLTNPQAVMPAFSTYDKKDRSKAVSSDFIDQEEVINCLAEDVSLFESKYIVSIFDYGGQNIFNVIHPFFLTNYGIYLAVFNMKQLSSSSLEKEREECLHYLRFWLNSIAVHAYDSQRMEIAPVFLVGTRKDEVSDPREHEEISKLLAAHFQYHSVWPFVVTNQHGVGSKGNTKFCFFPIDNTLGMKDSAIGQLMKGIEKEMSESYYVNQDVPLIWLQALDMMKAQGKSSFMYNEVEEITKKCRVSEKSIPYFLHFLHQMGIAMWHEESSLRKHVIFDPVKYFVTPATIIICKHSSSEEEGSVGDVTWHLLPIHEICRKRYFEDWKRMISYGLLSEPLLLTLLQDFPHRNEIVTLMEKYGLLLNVSETMPRGKTEQTRSYLVPALLPAYDRTGQVTSCLKVEAPSKGTNNGLTEAPTSHGFPIFFLVFYHYNFLEEGMKALLNLEEIQANGFLPNGFFERLLCKVIQSCMTESHTTNQSSEPSALGLLSHLSRSSAVLNYREYSFALICHLAQNMIEIQVFHANPIPVYIFVMETVDKICQEAYHSLKKMVVLPKSSPSSTTPAFVKLASIESYIEQNRDLQITIHDRISFQNLRQEYNRWLYRYKQSLPLSNYDIFISYRWNVQDSLFVNHLFAQFHSYNLVGGSSSDRVEGGDRKSLYNPISVFLDHQRLQFGENFRENFVQSLYRSRVIIPIVTTEALTKLIQNTQEEKEDNLLLEWILVLHLQARHHGEKGRDQHQRILPIIFGSYRYEVTTKEVMGVLGLDDPHTINIWRKVEIEGTKQENQMEIETLSNVKVLDVLVSQARVPTKTIEIAKQMLRTQLNEELHPSIEEMTTLEIVKKLLLFQGFYYMNNSLASQDFPLSMPSFSRRYCDKIVQTLQQMYDNAPSMYQTRLQERNDCYYYNQQQQAQTPRIQPSELAASPKTPITEATAVVPGKESSVKEVTVMDEQQSVPSLSVPITMEEVNEMISNHIYILKFFEFQELAKRKEFGKAKELQKELKDRLNPYKSKNEYENELIRVVRRMEEMEKELEEKLLQSADLLEALIELTEKKEEVSKLLEEMKSS